MCDDRGTSPVIPGSSHLRTGTDPPPPRIQMLDGLRYLVVWNPIIFMLLSVLFHLFTPHHHGHQPPGLNGSSHVHGLLGGVPPAH